MQKTELDISHILNPIYVELGRLDFFELFKKVEKEFDTCFLLESLGENAKDARYSVIGFSPPSIVSAEGNTLNINGGSYKVENPYYELKNFIPKHYISSQVFSGGLVGYISYDAVSLFEPALSVKPHKKFPLFLFGLYEDGLVYDKTTSITSYFYHKENRSGLIEKLINEKKSAVNSSLKIKAKGDSMTKGRHHEAVKEIIEEIKKGNTFQCQVGIKRLFEIEGDTLLLYEGLRDINPSPHMYYLKFKEKIIIGASPELLLNLHDGIMETYPLAGTIKRGKSAEEDMGLAQTMLTDPKELAEHRMLVDLHRNDLGKVSRIGTVKISALMEVKRYSHVQHISSEVVGVISPKEDAFTALAAVFPAGTLSGTPKIESMKIIERLENNPRGPYGGAIGYFGFNGDCKMAIPIRSLFISDREGYAQASGGVVWDSTPEGEYMEIQNKLAGMQKAIEPFIV
ncbi:MAG TPA: anthranilate synthase component I family protein [Bacteroidia bacterium]|jgi:anthranilate synthase component 1|nr:anthranilate synthase component I family protein [Bacteroidia bacterium]